jgi:hypothetical protein
MRYQRLVASIALKTVRDRGEAEDVIQPVLPAMFPLRHFGETPKCRAPRPLIEIETYAQQACFLGITTHTRRPAPAPCKG